MTIVLPRHTWRLLTAALILTLAACATTPNAERQAARAAAQVQDAERLAYLRAHADAPVDRVRTLRRIDHYEVLGPEAALLWAGPFHAWLVELESSAACRHLDKTWRVALTSMHDTLNVRNTYLVNDIGQHCKVIGIRPVDRSIARASTPKAP